jgi:hypothetical protein
MGGMSLRARINAWFFRAMDGYAHRKYRHAREPAW